MPPGKKALSLPKKVNVDKLQNQHIFSSILYVSMPLPISIPQLLLHLDFCWAYNSFIQRIKISNLLVSSFKILSLIGVCPYFIKKVKLHWKTEWHEKERFLSVLSMKRVTKGSKAPFQEPWKASRLVPDRMPSCGKRLSEVWKPIQWTHVASTKACGWCVRIWACRDVWWGYMC